LYTLNGELRLSSNDQGQTPAVRSSTGVVLGAASSLSVWESNGVYLDPVTSIIIHNDGAGAIAGSFAGIANQLAFIDLNVAYDAGDGNDVSITLQRNSTQFASVALLNNQLGPATAFDANFSQMVG
jgi:hypothetical protein